MADGEHRSDVVSGAVDFGKSSDDYSKYRPGLPSSWYSKLDDTLYAHFGGNASNLKLKILDLGCGPGTISFELLNRYTNCTVIGVDISENQIAAANQRLINDQRNEAGLCHRGHFYVGSSDDLSDIPQIKAHSIDVVICGQCWPWFDAEQTLVELERICNPQSGLLIIVQYSYLPTLSVIAHLTEQLIVSKEYNPNWKHAKSNGLYPQQIEQILDHQGQWSMDKVICYDYDQPFSIFKWIKRITTCNGLHQLDSDKMERFNQELQYILESHLKSEYGQIPSSFTVKHRVWMVVARLGQEQYIKIQSKL